MKFRDRADAGRRLAEALAGRDLEAPIVLGIARGGVTVAAEVARRLNGQLGVVVCRKLGAPTRPELAIGAVTADGTCYIDEERCRLAGASDSYIERERLRQTAEAQRQQATYGYPPALLAGRIAIVVDDGLATGATAIAAIRSVKAGGAGTVVFAVPVGPPHSLERVRREADEVLCASVEPDFFAVGWFYDDFRATTDGDVRALLESAAPPSSSPS